MKKQDLKKLALMGLTTGVLLTSQTEVQADEAAFGTMLAANCGGKHGCGHSGDTAYNPRPNQKFGYYTNDADLPTTYYNNREGQWDPARTQGSQWQNQQPQQWQNQSPAPQYQYQNQRPQYQYQGQPYYSACGAVSQPQHMAACGASHAPQGQMMAGCGARSQAPQGQMMAGCGARSQAPQGQMMAACGAARPNQGQSPAAPNQAGVYTKWEQSGQTADNSRGMNRNNDYDRNNNNNDRYDSSSSSSTTTPSTRPSATYPTDTNYPKTGR